MKKLLFLILALTMILSLCACGVPEMGYNKQVFDLTYGFDEVVIALPNGDAICGKVDTWTDFENSDQIQVTVNGVTYYTHSTNVVLIAK